MSQQERRLEAVLDVISLLCDRQQKEMQDAMRENKSFYVIQCILNFYA